MARLSVAVRSAYVHHVSTPDADSLAELIADCAELPEGLRTAAPAVPPQRIAPDWSVDDASARQAAQFDDHL